MDDVHVLLSDLSGYKVAHSRMLQDRMGIELVDSSGAHQPVVLELIGVVAYLDKGLVGAALSKGYLNDPPGPYAVDVRAGLGHELPQVKELFLNGQDGSWRLRCLVGVVSYRPGPLGNDLC